MGRKNIPRDFIKECIKELIKNQFVQIPPGAPCSEPIPPHLVVPNAPPIRYMQGDNAFCLFYAMAAALDFVGYVNVGSKLRNAATKMSTATNFEQVVEQIVRTDIKYLHAIHFKTGKYDPVRDMSIYPTFMILQGIDLAANHAVAAVGPWLFDANLPHAIHICPASLDWCVSTDEEKVRYKQVYFAVSFREHSDKKKPRYRNPFENRDKGYKGNTKK